MENSTNQANLTYRRQRSVAVYTRALNIKPGKMIGKTFQQVDPAELTRFLEEKKEVSPPLDHHTAVVDDPIPPPQPGNALTSVPCSDYSFENNVYDAFRFDDDDQSPSLACEDSEHQTAEICVYDDCHTHNGLHQPSTVTMDEFRSQYREHAVPPVQNFVSSKEDVIIPHALDTPRAPVYREYSQAARFVQRKFADFAPINIIGHVGRTTYQGYRPNYNIDIAKIPSSVLDWFFSKSPSEKPADELVVEPPEEDVIIPHSDSRTVPDHHALNGTPPPPKYGWDPIAEIFRNLPSRYNTMLKQIALHGPVNEQAQHFLVLIHIMYGSIDGAQFNTLYQQDFWWKKLASARLLYRACTCIRGPLMSKYVLREYRQQVMISYLTAGTDSIVPHMFAGDIDSDSDDDMPDLEPQASDPEMLPIPSAEEIISICSPLPQELVAQNKFLQDVSSRYVERRKQRKAELEAASAHPEISIFQKIKDWVKNLPNAAFSAISDYVIDPIVKYFSSRAALSFWQKHHRRIINTVVLSIYCLIAFIGTWVGMSHGVVHGLIAAFCAFIGTHCLFIGACAIAETSAILKPFLEVLAAGHDLTYRPHAPGYSSFDFDWFCGLASNFGVTFIYQAEKISKAWGVVRGLQEFGLFIFEMFPLFIQEAIMQAYPNVAMGMLYKGCGWQMYAKRFQALLDISEAHLSAIHVDAFNKVKAESQTFLAANLGKPWYNMAKTDYDNKVSAFQQISVKVDSNSGRTPFMVQFGGRHNLGKTEIAKITANMFASLHLKRQVQIGYFVKPEGQYWDGYANEPVILFKDILGISEDKRTADADNWCGLYDGAFKPDVANINQAFAKNSQINPAAVVAATNFLHPEAVYNFNNLKSYCRKRHYTVEVVPRPDLAPKYNSSSWAGILADMSPLEQRNFEAMRYRFVHPENPEYDGPIPHATWTDPQGRTSQLHYLTLVKAKDMLLILRESFTRFRAQRETENHNITGLLDDMLVVDKALWKVQEALQTPSKEERSIVKKLIIALAAFTPIITLVCLFIRNEWRKNKMREEYDEDDVDPHSVGASRQRGRAARVPRVFITNPHMADQLKPQLERVSKQIVDLRFDGMHRVYGVMITGDIMATVAHPFRAGQTFQARRYSIKCRDGIELEQFFEPRQITFRQHMRHDVIHTNDIIFIKMRNPVRGMADISRYFINDLIVPSKVYHVSQDKFHFVDCAGRHPRPVVYRAPNDPLDRYTNLLVENPVKYEYKSIEGECGLPVCTEYQGRLVILGIHTGCNVDHSFAGSIINKQIPTGIVLDPVEDANGMDTVTPHCSLKMPAGNYAPVGLNSHNVVTPLQTQLARTDFPDAPDHGISIKSPQILLDREERFGKPCTKCPTTEEHEYAIAVAVDCYTRAQRPSDDRSVLTPQEAVDRLPRDKSVGYPHRKKRSELAPRNDDTSSFTMADWDPEFLKTFQTLHDKLLDRRFPPAVITPCLKDETLPKEKLLLKKTRTFEIFSLEWTIIGKMYFGNFLDYLTRSWFDTPSAIGMDVNSVDFHRMVEKLEAHSPFFTTLDYSAFEAQVTIDSAESFLACAQAFYQDGEDSITAHVRRAYIYAAISPAVVAGRAVWRRHTGNPSGIIGTVQLNSVVNTYFLALAYKNAFPAALVRDFSHDVAHKTCGDDVVAALLRKTLETYNLPFIARYLGELGITVTDGEKSGRLPIWIPRHEATFLSANLLYSEDFKAIVAYIPDAKMKAQAAYCRDVSVKGQHALALSILHNAAMHGMKRSPEFPEDHTNYPQWVAYFQKVFPDLQADTFQAILNDFNRYRAADNLAVEYLPDDGDEDYVVITPHGNTQTSYITNSGTMTGSGGQHATNTTDLDLKSSVGVGGGSASTGDGGSGGRIHTGWRGLWDVGVATLGSKLFNDHRSSTPASGRTAPRSRSVAMHGLGDDGTGFSPEEVQRIRAKDDLYGATLDQPNHTFATINVDAPNITRTTLTGVDTADNLGDVAACIDAVQSHDFGMKEDQMSQLFFTRHFSNVAVVNVPYTNSAGALLGVFPMDPFQRMPLSISQTTTPFFPTKLETWAMQFGYWRGDIEFRFHLAAPRETAVRLAFVLAYNDFAATPPSYQTAVTGVCVVKDFDQNNRDVTIRVPYISGRDWLLPYFRNALFPGNITAGVPYGRDDTCSLGLIRIYQATKVASSTASFTTPPLLLVYISGGENFQTKRYLGVAGVQDQGQYSPSDLIVPHMAEGTTVMPVAKRLDLSAVKYTPSVPSIQLKKFARKAAVVGTVTVTTSATPSFTMAHPAATLVAQADYAQLAMKYYRGDLVVRVTPLGSGWVGGHYILYWAPYTLAGAYTGNPVRTDLDYVIIDLASNQAVELKIPYQYHKEFFTSGGNDFFGTVSLEPLTSFQAPTTGTSSIDLEIQVYWENFESYIPAEIGLAPSLDTIVPHMAEDKAVESAAITSKESTARPAIAPIQSLIFGSDGRIVSHLSDILKRPFSQSIFAMGSEAFTQISTNPFPPLGSFRWLWNQYRAWKGDQIYTIDAISTVQPVEMWVNLQPTTEYSGQTANEYLTTFKVQLPSSTTFPGDTLPGLGTNNWADSAPAIFTKQSRIRVNVPYHSTNRFIVNDPATVTGLLVNDISAQSELTFWESDTTRTTSNFRLTRQTADSFRLAHYAPTQMAIYSFNNDDELYINYPGQYFNVV